MKLAVSKKGLYTTIQDNGRYLYQKYGISRCGALDDYAFRVANMLVNNELSEAVLELTLFGGVFEVLESGFISITGADMDPKINNKSAPMWETLELNKGDILSFKAARNGCRTYIAIAGGIDVPLVLNSRSTYIRGKIGGFNGSTLDEGDVISSMKKDYPSKYILPSEFIPIYNQKNTARVIFGPQFGNFTRKGIETFLDEEYVFTNDINRMACRLEGSPIEHKYTANIISDGTPNGAIQVPENGKPIILLNDRQTTGGYPKIACIITTDIQKIAQAKPNDSISFKVISVSKAHLIYRNYINNLDRLKRILNVFR